MFCGYFLISLISFYIFLINVIIYSLRVEKIIVNLNDEIENLEIILENPFLEMKINKF